MSGEKIAEEIIEIVERDIYNDAMKLLVPILDNLADEQVEACVTALQKELHLWLPKDRMDNIVDICRDASLTKIGKLYG